MPHAALTLAFSQRERARGDGCVVCFRCSFFQLTFVFVAQRENSHVSQNVLYRPPAWAPRDRVKVYRNGQAVATEWRDAYVVVKQAAVGDTLTMTWPMLRIVQKQNPGHPNIELTVTWLGNTVLKLEPRGRVLPLFP